MKSPIEIYSAALRGDRRQRVAKFSFLGLVRQKTPKKVRRNCTISLFPFSLSISALLVCMLSKSTLLFSRTSTRLFRPPTQQIAKKMSTSKFPVSDRVAPELQKSSDVWSVFSPLAGHVPKDALNLGQVSFSTFLKPHLEFETELNEGEGD